MTEQEWLAATDPAPMLAFMDERASGRKTRLVRVAAARSCWPEFTSTHLRSVVETGERYVDGGCTLEELGDAVRSIHNLFGSLDIPRRSNSPAFHLISLAASCVNLPKITKLASGANWSFATRHVSGILPHILRDIFGPLPFRHTPFNPSWLTSPVLALAAQMYESRDFSAMPILDDALQDAGCDSAEVLDHCRGDGPPVRGCWVVDLVLGKE